MILAAQSWTIRSVEFPPFFQGTMVTDINADDLVRSHPIFRDLGDHEIEQLLQVSHERKLVSHEPLFLKGDSSGFLFFVKSGKIQISTSSVDGKEVILDVLKQGDCFGEIGLFDGQPRTADAIAYDASVVLMLPKEAVLRIVESNTGTAKQVIQFLCDRIRWVSDTVEDLAFLKVEERLAKRIIHLCHKHGKNIGDQIVIDFPVSQEHLANMAGMTRERANLVLNKWKNDGLIITKRNEIRILDIDALFEIFCRDL